MPQVSATLMACCVSLLLLLLVQRGPKPAWRESSRVIMITMQARQNIQNHLMAVVTCMT
jgi:hypothetical protein